MQGTEYLPVIIEQTENGSLIRMEGQLTVPSAEALKSVLLEGLATGGSLALDLERVTEIGITTLQLLWAAGREASRKGTTISIRASEAAERAARDAGFGPFPGLDQQGEPWPR